MKKLFLLALFCAGYAAHAQVSPTRAARFQHLFDSVCNRLHIKGAQAAVQLPGVGLWQGASGISHPGAPMDTTMQLGIGSNTKTYVSALLLKLQEQSMLSLNDTIGTWFSGLTNVPGNITVRQLLNHTSGLGDYTITNQFWDSINTDYNRLWTPEEMLTFIPPPAAAPGGAWEYCNTNYLLAGLIAEHVTGQSLSTALRTHILQPAGLTKTFLWGEEQPTATVPHVWSQLSQGAPQDDLDVWGYSHNAFLGAAHGAGALLSTAGDNARFWHALTAGQMLSAPSLAQMRQYVSIGGTARYGLGVFRYTGYFGGRTVWSHGGTGIGFINDNAVDTATGICVTVLTNQDSIDNDQIFLQVIGALMRDAILNPTAVEGGSIVSADAVVYPVPATDVLYVRSETPLAILELTDAMGRVVQRQNAQPLLTTIAVADVPPGVYLLRGYRKGGAVSLQQKVVVAR